MGFLSVLSFAHGLVQQRVRPGDTAIDATAGNGNDTLLLCRLVGPSGRVVAFDVQPAALEQTRRKLSEAGVRMVPADSEGGDAGLSGVSYGNGAVCKLIQASHDEMERYIEASAGGGVAAVMFNLGYLPGAKDASPVITRPDTTLPALEAAVRLLRIGGVLTTVLYPGHPGGREEADGVEAWAAGLPQQEAQTVMYRFANAPLTAPYLIAVEKKSSPAYNQS